ncbi:MAG TPA: hypothetical protein VJ547_07755 [Candidatus Thermoplasmatota archaeon]|nr:hypothetical protein [Candidatus Thermoplasmatota archaeon]
MEPKERCDMCAHWDNRPELEMASNAGYCDYHEKMFKADYWCKFYLHKTSAEALQYRREIYGATDEDDEENEMDV